MSRFDIVTATPGEFELASRRCLQLGDEGEDLWHLANQEYHEIVQQLVETRLNGLFEDEPAESGMEKEKPIEETLMGKYSSGM